MVAKNLFRPRHALNRGDMLQQATNKTLSPCEQKLIEYEEQLAHLSKQKELHTLALKEMYQFLCKLDTSFKEENLKLKDLIEIEQSRSAKLIEVTKGLWDIVELMDDGKPGPANLAATLTREVKELTNLEIEVSDESHKVPVENSVFPQIEEIAPSMAAV